MTKDGNTHSARRSIKTSCTTRKEGCGLALTGDMIMRKIGETQRHKVIIGVQEDHE
jgi:hypothetical protein